MSTRTTADPQAPRAPWPQWFAVRNRLARQYWHRHGQHVPLEEYYSAGNEALAQVYRASGAEASFSTVEQALHWAMRRVPRAALPKGNTIATHDGRRQGQRIVATVPQPPQWDGWHRLLRPVWPSGYQRTLADEVLVALLARAEVWVVAALLAMAWGWHTRELPEVCGHSRATIGRHLQRLRAIIGRERQQWEFIATEENLYDL